MPSTQVFFSNLLERKPGGDLRGATPAGHYPGRDITSRPLNPIPGWRQAVET